MSAASLNSRRLSELTSLISSGSTPHGGQNVYLDTGPVMLIRSQNVHMNQMDLSEVAFIPNEIDSQMKRSVVQYNDVLLNITGASIGRVARFNLEDQRANVNQHVCIIRANPNLLHAQFLVYWLCSSAVQNDIHHRYQHGGTRQALTFQQIADFEIPLPPLSEQKRIADILDKADAIRRKRQEVQSILRKLPASVFDATFGDPLQNPYQWKTVELKHLVAKGDKINYGIVQPGNHIVDGVPVIRVGDMQHISESLADLKKVSPTIHNRHKKSTLQGDEVLLACVGSIGLVALANEQMKGFNIVRAIARIRCNLDINREYLAAYLSTPFAQNYFSRATRTVSQPTLNIKQIEETPILVPPKTLQDEFVSYLSANHRVSDRCSLASHQSITLFDSLVQLAFNAELSTVAASRN